MKLRLIELQVLHDSNRQPEYICSQIHQKYNVNIAVDECRQLMAKFNIFTKWRYLLLLLTSIGLALASIWYCQLGIVASVVMLVLVPLIFNSLSEAMITFYALNHDVKDLSPPKMSMTDEHASVALVLPSRNEPFAVAKMTFD